MLPQRREVGVEDPAALALRGADPELLAEVALGERVHVVVAMRLEHVALQQRVVLEAAQLDAVVGEHVALVLEVLAEFGRGRVFQPRAQALQRRRARQLLGRAGVVVRQRQISGRAGFEAWISPDKWQDQVDEALRQALVNLEAVPAPAGPMTVVLGPGWPGILLHEAIGHGLEGDFNRRGTSAFTGRIGEQVASPLCTVVDDGTLPGRRGSLTIDDEGTPTSCTTLIENGVLKGYLQDKLNARLMGVKPTGNGRRESFAHATLPRMTNTYMLPGPHEPEEIIRSVQRGLYAVNFGGGQVDITSGKFVFSASEAYLIENGRITAPVKGATLVGNGPDVLTRVSMVGNDLMLDDGIGSCGKDGQTVPVGVGQPTLRVDALTVGGTA